MLNARIDVMGKRYWFCVFDYATNESEGKFNLGFVSDEKNPFNNENLKKIILKQNPKLKEDKLIMVYFKEFKTEKDYLDFWQSITC